MQMYLDLLYTGAIHSDIAVAVNVTHPDSTMFMETTALNPLVALAQMTIDENEIKASVAVK